VLCGEEEPVFSILTRNSIESMERRNPVFSILTRNSMERAAVLHLSRILKPYYMSHTIPILSPFPSHLTLPLPLLATNYDLLRGHKKKKDEVSISTSMMLILKKGGGGWMPELSL
jgi:hypothetical protein